MSRVLLLFLITGLALGLHARDFTNTPPYPPENGLLWEISGNGIKRPGYLYGTMHVSGKMVFNLSDSFFMGLRQADFVALETNHDEWQAFTERLADASAGNPFSGLMFGGNYGFNYRNLYNDAFRFEAPTRELLGDMLSVKPIMTNEYLYRTNEAQQEYEEDTYLDLFIFQAGKKLGKKVIGLETIEGSYESVLRARIPDDHEPERKPNPFGAPNISLEEAYRNQNLELIDSINRMSNPNKNFHRWMLDERNVVMANRIDSILQSGSSIFSAVGAAHLPGSEGVISLLRKKGYAMRPVGFTNNNGGQEKEKIDKIRYPVTISRHWLVDSTWSAESPGRFYPTNHSQGFEQHLCADMSNGVFYAIYRLNTYGWWTGQRPEYIADRLDSLIYERIPGKIFERKRLQEPFPGHEISTRTRRGDVQRFKIFVTPSEIVMFTTGGNGDYALGEEASRFLNSIQYKAPSAASMPPPTGGYTVAMPGQPVVNTTQNPKAQQHLAASMTPSDSATYFLYRTDFHDVNYIEEDTFELNIIGMRIAEQFTKKPPATTLRAESPYPTQDIAFRSDRDSSRYFIRLVIDGPHYYVLGCRKHSDEAPTAYFNSFKIQLFLYPEGFKTRTDTTLHFEVNTIREPEKPGQAFADRLKKIYEQIAQGSNRLPDGEDETSNGYHERFTTIRSPLTGEEVMIRVFEAWAGTTLPSLDSFQNNVVSGLTRHNKMALWHASWNQDNGMLSGRFLLSDTNSTRGIMTAIYVVNRKSWRLTASVNLDGELSDFIRNFFDSFKPGDRPEGSLLFGKKDLAFLNNLYVADSLQRVQALNALRRHANQEQTKADFAPIRAAIEAPAFSKLKARDRQALIQMLAKTRHEAVTGYLKQYYVQHADSLRDQTIVLENLCSLKTKASFEAFFDLWPGKNPLYLGQSMGEIFAALNDTLELSARFVPQLLPLISLETVREPVLNLLDNLLHKNLIKPRAYQSILPTLLLETNWLLNKHRLDGEASTDKKENWGYAEDYTGTNEQTIMRNMNLMLPFADKNRQVKALADAVSHYGNHAMKIKLYGLYLKHGLPVSRGLLKPFTTDDNTRFLLYQQIEMAGKTQEYADWFRDTTALIRAYLADGRPDQSQFVRFDSIRLLSKHQYQLYSRPATLYFFETRKKDSKDWELVQVAVPQDLQFFTGPGAERKANRRTYLSLSKNYQSLPLVRNLPRMNGKERDAYIRKVLGEIRYVNRERYRSPNDGRYYYPGAED